MQNVTHRYKNSTLKDTYRYQIKKFPERAILYKKPQKLDNNSRTGNVNKSAHKPHDVYKMSTKLHITQQYVYKTANNIHVYKTCLKKAKKYTHVAAQQIV